MPRTMSSLAQAERAQLSFDPDEQQVYPSAHGSWDSHQKLRDNHTKLCSGVDRPVAGLLKDLKARGLLDEVVVVFCTEFGRTPGLELRAGAERCIGEAHGKGAGGRFGNLMLRPLSGVVRVGQHGQRPQVRQQLP